VNAVDANCSTALMLAADRGHAPIVQLLLSAPAAVNAADVGGWTALQKAANKGHILVVRLLLSAGVAVNAADAVGWTALRKAASNGHTAVVQLLLGAQEALASEEDLACAAVPAAAAGHVKLAVVLLKALMARDSAAAATLLADDVVAATGLRAAALADPSVAVKVLGLWQSAEDTRMELDARRPHQELVVSVATTHQQLQAAAAGIATFAVTSAVQAVRQMPGPGVAASEAVVLAAATSSAVAAVAAVAPLAQAPAAVAAAAAVPTRQQKGAAPAGDADAGKTALEGLRSKRTKVWGCDMID
jgi:hypothetical protein